MSDFIGMKVTGLDELYVRLSHGGPRVKENARKVMHRQGDAIKDRAVLYAPVDDGELEQSIHIDKGYEDSGRLTIAIVAGGDVNGVNVDAYAALIHEHYESMKPGPNTIAKRAANPSIYIGEKFLDRAAKDSQEKLEKALIKSVMSDMEDIVR